jgi:hypothetical protein
VGQDAEIRLLEPIVAEGLDRRRLFNNKTQICFGITRKNNTEAISSEEEITCQSLGLGLRVVV